MRAPPDVQKRLLGGVLGEGAIIQYAASTGRKVVGSMSGNQQEPDMICEVFILAQNSLLD